MAKFISITTFPRTQWRESMGLRKTLARAFNTSRNSEKRLLSMAAWLRYTTTQVNAALLELETGQPAAEPMKGATADIIIKDDVVEVPAITIAPVALDLPKLINVEK